MHRSGAAARLQVVALDRAAGLIEGSAEIQRAVAAGGIGRAADRLLVQRQVEGAAGDNHVAGDVQRVVLVGGACQGEGASLNNQPTADVQRVVAVIGGADGLQGTAGPGGDNGEITENIRERGVDPETSGIRHRRGVPGEIIESLAQPVRLGVAGVADDLASRTNAPRRRRDRAGGRRVIVFIHSARGESQSAAGGNRSRVHQRAGNAHSHIHRHRMAALNGDGNAGSAGRRAGRGDPGRPVPRLPRVRGVPIAGLLRAKVAGRLRLTPAKCRKAQGPAGGAGWPLILS